MDKNIEKNYRPDQPEISIIMPIYNVEKYIAEAVDSIKKQTFKNWELIIIDDCSSDDTRTIVKKKIRNDERIRFFVNNHNQGITYGLNKGITLAKANIIARMDGDDISSPERLEKQLQFLKKHKDYLLIGSQGKIINEEGKFVGNIKYPCKNLFLKIRMLQCNSLIHGSVMIRKDIFKKIGGYSGEYKYAEDYALWLQIMRYGKIGNLPEELYSWRRNSTPSQRNVSIQMTSTEKARQHFVNVNNRYAFEKLIMKLLDFLKKIKRWILPK